MLNGEGDPVAVVRPNRQRAQHEKIEGSLEESGALFFVSSRHSTRSYGASERKSTGANCANVAVGYGRRVRLSAGWRLAAVRPACGLWACGCRPAAVRAAIGCSTSAVVILSEGSPILVSGNRSF